MTPDYQIFDEDAADQEVYVLAQSLIEYACQYREQLKISKEIEVTADVPVWLFKRFKQDHWRRFHEAGVIVRADPWR